VSARTRRTPLSGAETLHEIGDDSATPGPLAAELTPGSTSPGILDAADRTKRTPRPVWLGLIAVILIFMSLETLIAVKTPAYESADEPGHVQNIETLVGGQWYGMNGPCRLRPQIGLLQCAGDEAQQAPLYYFVFAGWQKLIEQPQLPPFNQRKITVDPAFFSGHSGIFLHHSTADLRFLLWLRLPNIPLGALTILITFFAVRLVSRDAWTPLVAASFIAFLPRILFLWPFVTNDNLTNFLGAVLTFASLKFCIAPSYKRMALVGVVFGLLLITKLSTSPLIFVILVLACLVPGWKPRIKLLAVGLLSAFAVSGWYLIQNALRYGDALARDTTSHYLSKIGGLGLPAGQPYVIGNPFTFLFIHVPYRILQTFWYLSDWNQFHWSWEVNAVLTLVFLATLLGLFRHGVDRRVLFTLAVISVAGFLSVYGVALQSYYQARYAFVGLAAIAGLVALGVERWRVPVRFLLPAMGLVGTLVAVQIDVLAIHWT
jgi:hypothetical protein